LRHSPMISYRDDTSRQAPHRRRGRFSPWVMDYGVIVSHVFADSVYLSRLEAVRRSAAKAGVDAVLVTPGPDLRYLTGYQAVPLERLTCLVVPAEGDPVMVVPSLEVLAAQASPIGSMSLGLHPWGETDDPCALVASLVPGARNIALDDHMWAEKVLRLRLAMPDAQQVTAGGIIHSLRMRKDEAEIDALRRAGAAIDRVHAMVPRFLRVGRTEREIGRDISDQIIREGHVRVDFVIVASGPNGASPHHEVSDRELQIGDPVVVDIGGTMPDGYCSDSTRTYTLGAPTEQFSRWFDVLVAAQQTSCDAVQRGVTCESIDEAGRSVLRSAGIGELFIHRTGHGIGLESHEEPYIVLGNTLPVEPGMVFSIEPGFYLEGVFGARIEDIVVCTADGYESMNNQPRTLVVVNAS
jgi:Xaa-Pro aminopeptidase